MYHCVAVPRRAGSRPRDSTATRAPTVAARAALSVATKPVSSALGSIHPGSIGMESKGKGSATDDRRPDSANVNARAPRSADE